MLRPQFRLPLAAAAGIPAVAYALRSLIRGSAALDLPGDVIVLGLVAFALLLGARYGSAAQRRRDELPGEVQDHHDRTGENREREEV